MFSLSHCTTQEMVSLIFSHLFTSLSLKGIVITTPSGRGVRITPRGHVQNIPSCHPQFVLREQPLSFSLAYYAPATLPSVPEHAKFINISGSFACAVLPEIISSFGHQLKHHHLSGDHPSPPGKSYSVLLSCFLFFLAFYHY